MSTPIGPDDLTRDGWGKLIDDADPATFGELARTLEDRFDVDADRATALLEDAVDAGLLVETETGGMFPEYRLDDEKPLDTGPEDENPTLETGEQGSPTSSGAGEDDTREDALEAFADAVEFFHRKLDVPIADHTDDGEHPDRPTTAREYFEDVRGWDPETVDEKRLGWAPANDHALLDYLMRQGHDRDAILGTGLFTEDFRALWQGRYVFPYFDTDGRPVYAISRSTGHDGGGAVGYDGHPADGMSGKYAKPAHTKPYARVSEPIYGLETLEDGRPVLITEGIADAITAHEAGYPCISPVTTQFKHADRDRVRDVLEDRDISRVYVVNDAEPATSDVDDEGRLTVEQFGAGEKGAVATAGYLADHGLDALVAELPRPGLEKVDLDDYLIRWGGDLSPVLAGAKPADHHPAYDPQETAIDAALESRSADAPTSSSDGTRSALFDLDIRDVTGLSWDYRGTNPLGHHGNSENYFVLIERHGVAFDHKYKVAYNALTYLLCDAGVRRPSSPNGSLEDREVLAAWRHAKQEGLIPDDDPIPHRALRHVALANGFCDADDVTDGWQLPTDAYNAALEYVDDVLGVDPGRGRVGEHAGENAAPVSALPLEQLDALSPEQRRQYAKRRGLEWPTTDEARDRLRDEVMTAIRAGSDVVLDAPTSLGKSHTVATEAWTRHAGTTGEQPVIHLAPTRKARDENVAKSDNAGVARHVLLGRKEACPVAGGDHDPNPDGEHPEHVVTIGGEPASEWFDRVCDGKGVPFSVAHQYLEEHHDQGYTQLPCSGNVDDDAGECPAVRQWKDVPRYEDGPAEGNPRFDVIHATHQFAYVPSLIAGCNVVIDEQPDFSVELSQDRIRRMVSAFLQEIGAPATTFEAFVSLARHDAVRGDAAKERDQVDRLLDKDPRREWFLEHPDAHALAPGIARALWFALKHNEPDPNGRVSWTLQHEPPRFDVDEDRGGYTWLTVVVDEQNTVRSIRNVPAFTHARSVVGLDAHPSEPLWQRNVHQGVEVDTVLEADERRLWRRYERGLTVVQVGEYTRPVGKNGGYYDARGDRAIMTHLRDRYGDEFSTGITGLQAKAEFKDGLEAAGVDEPEVMTYGSEKSRDDFGEESVGLVSHCIDPGDDFVLDLLAELGVEATPERVDPDDVDDPEDAHCDSCGGDGCSECNGTGLKRAHGRGFEGPDAEIAEAILASVRENHVAQAVGRYARSPDDPENTATVFMRTDAAPPGFADYQASGVEWTATDRQRQIIGELRERDEATARELADAVGTDKRYVFDVLERLEENGTVWRDRGAGDYNADVFHAGDEAVDEVDLEAPQPVSNPVRGSHTWSLILRDLSTGDTCASWSFSDVNPSDVATSGGDDPPDDAD